MVLNSSRMQVNHPNHPLSDDLTIHQVNRFPQRLLLLSPEEATFEKRGFTSDNSKKQDYLETVGKSFLYGYNRAIIAPSLPDLFNLLEGFPLNLRGFAYEGAAMALPLQ